MSITFTLAAADGRRPAINWEDDADVAARTFDLSWSGWRLVAELLARVGAWEPERTEDARGDAREVVVVERRDGRWERTTAHDEWRAINDESAWTETDRADRRAWDAAEVRWEDRPEATWSDVEFRTHRLLHCRAVHEARVPAAKFSSNDEWTLDAGECQVLADKCRRAADLAAAADDYEPGASWCAVVLRLAAFCDRAAEGRGFLVS